MKIKRLPVLIAVTLIFTGFTLGFFLGRNANHADVQVSVPVSMQTAPTQTAAPAEEPTEVTEAILFPININTAGKEEFMALPGIGEVLADRILAYRQEHGSFQAVDALTNVEGIGEKRMEEILDLITIGG